MWIVKRRNVVHFGVEWKLWGEVVLENNWCMRSIKMLITATAMSPPLTHILLGAKHENGLKLMAQTATLHKACSSSVSGPGLPCRTGNSYSPHKQVSTVCWILQDERGFCFTKVQYLDLIQHLSIAMWSCAYVRHGHVNRRLELAKYKLSKMIVIHTSIEISSSFHWAELIAALHFWWPIGTALEIAAEKLFAVPL